ncbi:MAG: hypothetical protein AAF847_11675 [Bacteroidota bacterium]
MQAQANKAKNGIARLLEIAGKRKFHLILSGILAVIHAALELVWSRIELEISSLWF